MKAGQTHDRVVEDRRRPHQGDSAGRSLLVNDNLMISGEWVNECVEMKRVDQYMSPWRDGMWSDLSAWISRQYSRCELCLRAKRRKIILLSTLSILLNSPEASKPLSSERLEPTQCHRN
jgi:hypothetical protein